MARSMRILLFFTISLGLFSCAVFAQGEGHGKAKGKNKQVEDDDHARGSRAPVIFSSRDRDIIRDYFRDRNSNLPPGLAKRGGNLPPGLEKHLQKNGTLPPGLQKRLTPFPRDLEIRLPRLPDIYRRGTIGDSVVIVDRRTQRVIDVINDILRP
jgi:hypothetical protein